MIPYRQGLVATIIILLLSVGTVFYLRLDVNSLEEQAIANISRMTGGRIRAQKASFSLQHATLRLKGIKMESGSNNWSFSAKEIQANLKFWPLLFGEVRMDTVYLISPTLNLTATPSPPTLSILTRLLPEAHLERLVARQGTISILGIPYANQAELDLRRTSPGDNTLIEIRADIGKGTTHLTGYAERNNSGPSTMSGKIEMDNISIAQLLGRPSPLTGYNMIGTSLTYNVSDKMAWQLFGDVILSRNGENKKSPDAITLRGKLTGTGSKAFSWKEGFVSVGDNATITTDGTYTRKNGCTIHAKTDHLPLKVAGGIVGITDLDGDAKGTATLNWQHNVWLADARTTLEKLHWSGIDFPKLQVTWSGIRHRTGRTDIASADITQPGKQGDIKLDTIESTQPDWQFSATATDVDGWWAGMANALLALHGRKPDIRGAGSLSAHINATHRQGNETMVFEAHADGATIHYGKQFTKPKGVSASISGNVEIDSNGQQLTISSAQLASSTLRQLQWQQRGDRQSLGIMQAKIDFSALHKQGVQLPDSFGNWRGKLSGNLSNHTFRARENQRAWLADLDATLRLQGFGNSDNGWSGALRVKNGMLESSHMAWRGSGQQKASVSGTLNLASHKGRINLHGITFNWLQEDKLPSWFSDASIRGHIQADRFTWAKNSWEGVKAGYQLHGNQLTLKDFDATLAGGSMSSKRLSLTVTPDSVHFAGPLRMGLVQLQKIHGLDSILGAPPHGYLYMNSRLEGTLPFNGLAAWKGSGDIEIQRGGWRGGDFTLRLPGHASGEQSTHLFSRTSSHFDIAPDGIDLTNLQVESGDTIASGSAHIAGNGTLTGQMHIKDKQGTTNGRLTGRWPHVDITRP